MVELIFDRTCPNVGAAREEIAAALRRVGLPTQWQGCPSRDAIVAALVAVPADGPR